MIAKNLRENSPHITINHSLLVRIHNLVERRLLPHRVAIRGSRLDSGCHVNIDGYATGTRRAWGVRGGIRETRRFVTKILFLVWTVRRPVAGYPKPGSRESYSNSCPGHEQQLH